MHQLHQRLTFINFVDDHNVSMHFRKGPICRVVGILLVYVHRTFFSILEYTHLREAGLPEYFSENYLYYFVYIITC